MERRERYRHILSSISSGSQEASLIPTRRERRKRQDIKCFPMPGMTEGHADGFVNRRRDLHRLYPDLRQGISNTLIITGEPGRGKSALANRLARMLAASGYLVIPLGEASITP